MKAKKIMAGVCASLMLAAVAIPTVSAADALKGSISKTEAEVGGKFSVKLDLEEIPASGINGCDFGIKYDSSVITVTDVSLGSLAKEENNAALDGVNALEVGIEPGLVSIIYGLGTTDSADYMKGSGTFLVIDGTVSKTAKAGDKSSLEVVAIDRLTEPDKTDTNAEIIFANLSEDNSFTLYDPTITPGEVKVAGGDVQTTTEPSTQPSTGQTDPPVTNPLYTGPIDDLVYGDVDLSGSVNVADVTKLAKYFLNTKTYRLGDKDNTPASVAQAMEQADVAHNGVVDKIDLSKLIEHCLGAVPADQLGK